MQHSTDDPEAEHLAEVLQHLKYLAPTVRSDFVACELAGMSQAERAVERNVEPGTVSTNIKTARDRLESDIDYDRFAVQKLVASDHRG